MSRDGSVTLDWADGTYAFRLGWGEWEKLQDATDCGPEFLFQRLTSGKWKVGDISHTLRLGLIGGGLEPVPALKLVREYVEKRPPMENLLHAQAVCMAGLMGNPEDVQKKSDLETSSLPTTSPMDGSASAASTAPGPQ